MSLLSRRQKPPFVTALRPMSRAAALCFGATLAAGAAALVPTATLAELNAEAAGDAAVPTPDLRAGDAAGGLVALPTVTAIYGQNLCSAPVRAAVRWRGETEDDAGEARGWRASAWRVVGPGATLRLARARGAVYDIAVAPIGSPPTDPRPDGRERLSDEDAEPAGFSRRRIPEANRGAAVTTRLCPPP